MSTPHAAVVTGPIDPAEVLARVGDPSDGAVLLFLGTVRDHAGENADSTLVLTGIGGPTPGYRRTGFRSRSVSKG